MKLDYEKCFINYSDPPQINPEEGGPLSIFLDLNEAYNQWLRLTFYFVHPLVSHILNLCPANLSMHSSSK